MSLCRLGPSTGLLCAVMAALNSIAKIVDVWIEQYLPAGLHAVARKPDIQAAAVIFLASLLLWIVIQAGNVSKGSRKVVLVGPCNAGKTCLFYQLTGTNVPEATVASMQENEGTCQILNEKKRRVATVQLVDVPGHERLRHKLDLHLKDASAIIFVLDAVEITPHKVDAAEELFEVLTHPSVARRRPPILLACNKMDLETQAHSVDFIRRTLEKQLDAMRKTRTALSKEAAAKSSVLGKSDKPLSLSNLRNYIKVVPMSALTGDIAGVNEYLLSTVRR